MPNSKTSLEVTRETLLSELEGLSLSRPNVRFLLGTDEHIAHEARVAMSPHHLEMLQEDLQGIGIEPEIFVISGAGDRAKPAFTDEDYELAGAEVVTLEEAAELDDLDVVHALKEPTEYEATLPGSMLRIGALHLASKPPGICELLAKRNFSAILDGGTVGNCSYLLVEGDRTPIVGSMSRFAGMVAGRKLVEGLDRNGVGPGKVVIVGGGIAGRSAIREVGPKTEQLVVIEPWEPMRRRLKTFLSGLGFTDVVIQSELTDATLEGAVGLVFAHRSGAKAAEKVCNYEQIQKMAKGAAISDIAIDQGGSIAHDGYDEQDDATTARRKYIELLGDDFAYYAEVNMPREEPHHASITHGDASLPYVTALLALCAQLGSPEAATRRLLEYSVKLYNAKDEVEDMSLFDAILQDLRNGIQLAQMDGEIHITDEDIKSDASLSAWLKSCAES